MEVTIGRASGRGRELYVLEGTRLYRVPELE
jgi:hypothetical protein